MDTGAFSVDSDDGETFRLSLHGRTIHEASPAAKFSDDIKTLGEWLMQESKNIKATQGGSSFVTVLLTLFLVAILGFGGYILYLDYFGSSRPAVVLQSVPLMPSAQYSQPQIIYTPRAAPVRSSGFWDYWFIHKMLASNPSTVQHNYYYDLGEQTTTTLPSGYPSAAKMTPVLRPADPDYVSSAPEPAEKNYHSSGSFWPKHSYSSSGAFSAPTKNYHSSSSFSAPSKSYRSSGSFKSSSGRYHSSGGFHH